MPTRGDPATHTAIGRYGQQIVIRRQYGAVCRCAVRQYKSGKTVRQRGLADPARTGHQHRMRHAARIEKAAAERARRLRARAGSDWRAAAAAAFPVAQGSTSRTPSRCRTAAATARRNALDIAGGVDQHATPGMLGGDFPKSGAQPLVKCPVEPFEAVVADAAPRRAAPAPRRLGDRGSMSDRAGNRRPQGDARSSTRRMQRRGHSPDRRSSNRENDRIPPTDRVRAPAGSGA